MSYTVHVKDKYNFYRTIVTCEEMLRDEGKMFKNLVLGLIFLGIGIYIFNNVKAINNLKIGKVLYLQLDDENINANYLEALVEGKRESNGNKLMLLSKEELNKLIIYMKNNNLKIVPGEYKISQGSSCEELVKSFRFILDVVSKYVGNCL